MLAAISLALLASVLSAQQSRDLLLQNAGAALDGKGQAWAVVVGVSKYENIPAKAQLKFADRDASAFAAFLRSPAGGGFPPEQIKLLVNETATLANIRTALGTWLPRSTQPDDVVYIFFAGHGVLEAGKDGYLVAHDSDPQNLYATALPVAELDRTISSRIRARHIVLIADACHAGSIGWTSRGDEDKLLINRYLEEAGKTGRSVVKLLASRPDERSFEDERWGGGHGAFTFHMLEGLRGKAERDGDGVVRADELVSYISSVVPNETKALQHPRVAGSIETRLPMAILRASTAAPPAPVAPAPQPNQPPSVEISGAPGTQVYIDNVPRGRIRPNGLLVLTDVEPGAHDFSVDLPDGSAIAQKVNIGAGKSVIRVQNAGASSVEQRRKLYAEADRIAALESAGQRGVNDYVTSTAAGLKHDLLQNAVKAYGQLRAIEPPNQELQAKQLFVEGRLRIAEGRFAEAIPLLERSITLDPHTACPYNAMGVAHERTGDIDRAVRFYQKAIELAPEWFLPHWQLGVIHHNRGKLEDSVREFQIASDLSPRAVMPRWMLVRGLRLLGRLEDARRTAVELINVNPNYAPTYLEIGQIYEAARQFPKAAEAFDIYLQLAPNFADSVEIRARSTKYKQQAARPAPTLKR